MPLLDEKKIVSHQVETTNLRAPSKRRGDYDSCKDEYLNGQLGNHEFKSECN